MTTSGRYQIIAGTVLCRNCSDDSGGRVVFTFDELSPLPVDEMNDEIRFHEDARHEVAFEDNASETGRILRRASKVLKGHAEAVQQALVTNEFFKRYGQENAYADAMTNCMGGPAGDMAALLGPDVATTLAKALREVSEMDGRYDELIQDHDRSVCDDFTCFVFGHLVEIARAVDKRIGRDGT